MSQQTSHNILSYFQKLLESNKLNFLRDKAINNIAERYGSLVESQDCEKGIIAYWGVFSDQHNTIEPVEALVTYDFYKEHKKELSIEANNVTKAIDELVYQKAEVDESSKGLLENINKELHYLSLRADKLYPDYTELREALKHIENHLLIRYQVKPFAKKRADEKFSYFGFKDIITRSKFRELYDIADKFEIIEYDVVDENTFLEVFLENPSSPDSVIKFNCQNSIAKLFIENIRHLFTSLNPKSIEKSGRFLTKGNTVLSETNYNRTKIKPSIENDKLIQEIDTILKE